MATVGKISINLTAGTAQFNADMDRASAKIREFGNHGVSSVQATSAALRTLEGGFSNNLRAAERFLATTLGLGNALKTAFPIFGAIALAGYVGKLVEKVGEAYQAFVKLQQAPTRIAGEFQALTQPIRIANDELAVTNDRLANQIAKLQGRGQNTLKLALDEARLSADKLAESLNRDLKEVQKLLQQEQIGAFKGLLTGTASTSGLTKQFQSFHDNFTQISLDTYDKLGKTNDPAAKAQIYQEATRRRKDALDQETKALKDQLTVAEALQKKRDNPVPGNIVGVIGGVAIPANNGPVPADQKAKIAELKGAIELLQNASVNVAETIENETLTKTKGGLEGIEKTKGTDALGKKLDELRDKAEGLRASLKAVGSDGDGDALAKSYAAALKDITEINRQRAEEKKQPLTLGQQADVLAGETTTALIERQIELKKKSEKVDEEGAATRERIAQDIAREQQAEDDRLTKIQEKMTELRAALTSASLGPDAASRAKIAAMPEKTPEDLAKKQEAQLEYQVGVQRTIAQIQMQTAATRELTAAQNLGLEAQRQAALANIQNSGKAAEEIKAEIEAQKAKYALEDAQTLRGASAADGAQRYFSELVDSAKSAGAQVHDALATAFSGANDTIAKLASGQKANFAGMFQSLGEQVTKNGLTNLEGKVFGSLGGAKSGGVWDEKAPGGGLLGKVGGLFGIGGSGKRDGSSDATALYVTMADLGSGPSSNPLASLASSGASDGSDGGGFFSKLGGFASMLFGGFRAEGGDVDPGHAYMVGERGPELWTPPSKGSIVPNHKLGGSTAYYSIDARGANEADVDMRVQRALTQVHGSAVRNSIAATQEARARRPRSKF